MSCRDYDVLVSLHAAGALDAHEAARVEVHLAGCAACRAEAGDLAAALSLAKLPPVSDAERRAFQQLGDHTLAELRRSGRVRSLAKRIAVVVAAAAAAAAVVLAPAVLQRPAAPSPSQAVWEPDLDTIWGDTAIIDVDASASTAGSADPGSSGAYAGLETTASAGTYADQGSDSPYVDAALTALDL